MFNSAPRHADVWRSGGAAPYILNVETGPEKTGYPLNRTLLHPTSSGRDGKGENVLCPESIPGHLACRLVTVPTIALLRTDFVIRAVSGVKLNASAQRQK